MKHICILALLLVLISGCSRCATVDDHLGRQIEITPTEASPPTASCIPVSTLTTEELVVLDLQDDTPQSASSREQCEVILQTESSCSVIKSAAIITRPEWSELFQETEFYLVEVDQVNLWESKRCTWLVTRQDCKIYSSQTFGHLLEANSVVVTEQNRETVARAFVLMSLSGEYLKEKIIMSKLQEADIQGRFSFEHYSYAMDAWTERGGLTLNYLFGFDEGGLKFAEGYVTKYGVGDYIDVPRETLCGPYPDFLTYNYRNQREPYVPPTCGITPTVPYCHPSDSSEGEPSR